LFASSLSKKYEAKLPMAGYQALQNLKRYFGRKNLISEIRNRFSFHNPSFEDIKNLLDSIPEEAELHMYLGAEQANSNYYLSEEVISRAMLKYVDSNNLKQAIEKMYKELIEVSGWFIKFSGHFLVALAEEHWGQEIQHLVVEKIDVESEGKIEEITIPFFVERQ
jgi:hypothetical protein